MVGSWRMKDTMVGEAVSKVDIRDDEVERNYAAGATAPNHSVG